MSSARKRTYKHKAYAEIDHLKQRLMLIEHHYSVMKVAAEVLAARVDNLRKAVEEARPVMEKYASRAQLEGFNTNTSKEVM